MIGNVGLVGRVGLITRRPRAIISTPPIINPFLGAAAVYSMRLNNGLTYTGPLIDVRRSTDNVVQSFGASTTVDINGNRWLDTTAILGFLGIVLRPLNSMVSLAAFGLRLLRDAYTGPCLRVRRSSDNAEQDIGFNALGNLNVTSLMAFVGTGGTNNGFVTAWYDQSGNGRHVTNATQGDQPRIVNAGVYSNEINFNTSTNAGRGRLLFATTLVPSAYPYTTNAVMRQVSNSASVILGNLAGAVQFFRIDNQATARFTPGNPYGTTFDATNYVVVTQTMNSLTNATGWAGGTNVGSTTSAVAQDLNCSGIGAWSGPVSNFALREIIIMQGAISEANRGTLERSQAAAYTTPYSPAIPSGLVSTWYDISGNSLNAVMATPGEQPAIASTGQIQYMGSIPALLFNASSLTVATTGNINAFALNAVARQTSAAASRRLLSITGNATSSDWNDARSANVLEATGSGFQSFRAGAQRSVVSGVLTNPFVATSVWGTQNTNFYNGAPGSVATYQALLDPTGIQVNIGRAKGDVNSFWNGAISEVTWYRAAISTTDRQTLERNQGLAYSITVA